MPPPRTVIVLGADAAPLLGGPAVSFQELLRRPIDWPPALGGAVRDLCGVDPGTPAAPDTLDFLALLDLDREHRKGHNRQALEQARRDLLVCAVRAETPGEGASPPGATALAGCLGPGDAVIALGPEERLEGALRGRLGWPAAWTPEDGYGVPFRRSRGTREAGTGRRSNVLVHKLRGSLGWVHCRRCRAQYAFGPVGAGPAPEAAHPCVHAADQREGVVAGSGMRGQPRFVLGRVRAAAAAALARADRLVLIGTAPDTVDPFVLWVLRRGVRDARRPPTVAAVGPAARIQGAHLRRLIDGREGPPLARIEELVSFLGRPGALF